MSLFPNELGQIFKLKLAFGDIIDKYISDIEFYDKSEAEKQGLFFRSTAYFKIGSHKALIIDCVQKFLAEGIPADLIRKSIDEDSNINVIIDHYRLTETEKTSTRTKIEELLNTASKLEPK